MRKKNYQENKNVQTSFLSEQSNSKNSTGTSELSLDINIGRNSGAAWLEQIVAG